MATPFIEASQGAVGARLGEEKIREALGWLALQSQQEQRKQQELAVQQKAGALAFAQLPQLSAPPPGAQGQPPPMTPPNAMPPGQPSRPMQAPPAGPPMGAPGGMPTLPGAPPAQPAAPPPWRPSAAASPELGGGGMPPPPGTPQTAAPNADILPPNLLTAQQAIEMIQKNPNIPEEMRYPTLQAMLPIMNDQNKLAITKWHAGIEAKKAATAAGKEKFNEIMKESELHLKEYGEASKDTLRRAQGAAVTARATAAGAGTATGGAEELTEGGKKVAAELIKAGRPLPGGWSKSGQSRGNAILNQMAIEQEGGAGSGSITSDMAAYKADSASLTLQQKRFDGIEASSKKIENDIKTMEKYLDKGAAGSVTLINKPINVLRRQFSDPALSEFALAAKLVGVEYERMINGALLSVAQLHEGAREDATKLLNEDMTPEQIRRIVPVMRQEINNSRTAIKAQLGEIKDRMKKKPEEGKTGKTATEYVETRTTSDGRKLGKKADGTIEEIK